jgi:hypothetical protein
MLKMVYWCSQAQHIRLRAVGGCPFLYVKLFFLSLVISFSLHYFPMSCFVTANSFYFSIVSKCFNFSFYGA